MQKSRFFLITPVSEALSCGWEAQMCDVLRQYAETLTPSSVVVLNRFHLSDAATQMLPLTAQLQRFHTEQALPAAQMLAARAVEQPVLSPAGCKVALGVWLIEDADATATLLPDDDARLVCTTSPALQILTQHFSTPTPGTSAYEQTRDAFQRHCDLLARHQMNLEVNCHRTWLFVRDIDREYAEVVAARNDVFATEGLTPATHFIASTGIGGRSASKDALLTADFLSIGGLRREQVHYVNAPEFLNPTHEYGVAFERATALTLGEDDELLFISGTASIDKHGHVLHEGNVVAQADRLFQNIHQLFLAAPISHAQRRAAFYVVYLRDTADAPAIAAYMQQHYPDVPTLLTLAPVCRPGWLIEVETIYC